MPSDTDAPEVETLEAEPSGGIMRGVGRLMGGGARVTGSAKKSATAKAGILVGKTVKGINDTAAGVSSYVEDVKTGVIMVKDDTVTAVRDGKENLVKGVYEGLGKERPLVSNGDINALKAPFKAKNDAALSAIVAEAALKGAQNGNGELTDAQLNDLVAKAKTQAGVTSIKGGGVASAAGLGLLGGVAASGYGLLKDVGQTNTKNTWKRAAVFAAIGAGLSLLTGGLLLLPLAIGGFVLGMMPKAIGFGVGGLLGVPLAVKAFNSFSGKYKDIDGPLRAQLRASAKLGHTHAQERGLNLATPQRGPDAPTPGAPAPGTGPVTAEATTTGTPVPPAAGAGTTAQANPQQVEDAARKVIDALKDTGHPDIEVAIAYLNQQLTARTSTYKSPEGAVVTRVDEPATRLSRAIRVFQRKMELSPSKGEDSAAIKAILDDVLAGRATEAVAGATTLKGKLTSNLANLGTPAGRVLSVQEALHTRDVIRQGAQARQSAATHAVEDAIHAHAVAAPIPIANVTYAAPVGNPIPGYEKMNLNIKMSGMVTGGEAVKHGEEAAGLKRQDGPQTAATR